VCNSYYCITTYRCGYFLRSQIISNTEHHIRVVEMLLQSDRWGEKLPECIVQPGLYALLTFGQSLLSQDLLSGVICISV